MLLRLKRSFEENIKTIQEESTDEESDTTINWEPIKKCFKVEGRYEMVNDKTSLETCCWEDVTKASKKWMYLNWTVGGHDC